MNPHAALVVALLAAPLTAQDAPDPRTEAVDALIEEYYDLFATNLEIAEAGDRIVALGPAAADRLCERVIADWRERHGSRAGELLERMRGDAAPAVPRLVSATRDEDLHVRTYALMALAEIGPWVRGFDPESVAPPAPGDASAPRDVPLETWERLRARCAVDVRAKVAELAAICAEPTADVATREMAAEALGQRGSAARDALPALRGLRDRAEQGTFFEGGEGMDLRAAGRITGAVARVAPATVEGLPDLERALRGRFRGYVPDDDQKVAVWTLAQLGSDGVPLLCDVLASPRSRPVRLEAILALERVGPPAAPALERLDALAGGEVSDERMRAAARQAAARIRGAGR